MTTSTDATTFDYRRIDGPTWDHWHDLDPDRADLLYGWCIEKAGLDQYIIDATISEGYVTITVWDRSTEPVTPDGRLITTLICTSDQPPCWITPIEAIRIHDLETTRQ